MTDLEKAKTSTDPNELIFLAGSNSEMVRMAARVNPKMPRKAFENMLLLENTSMPSFKMKDVQVLQKSGPFIRFLLQTKVLGRMDVEEKWKQVVQQAPRHLKPALKVAQVQVDSAGITVRIDDIILSKHLQKHFDVLQGLVALWFGDRPLELTGLHIQKSPQEPLFPPEPQQKVSHPADLPSDSGLIAEEVFQMQDEDGKYLLAQKLPHFKKPADLDFFAQRLKQGLEKHWEVREALALNPRINPDTINLLAQDPDWAVRQAISSHPRLTPSILGNLAHDRHSATTRANVAINPRTPVQILKSLAQDEDPEVRLNVAKNIATLPEDLAVLATDRSAAVREYAIAHPFAPHQALQSLQQDSVPNVMRVLRLRLQTLDEEAIETALKFRRTSVRLVLASHKDTPKEVLERLLQDKNPLVQHMAALHPKVNEAMEGKSEFPKRIEDLLMARSEVTSANQLSITRHHGNFYFALALSDNPKSPPDTLRQLSKNPHPEIRRRLLQNPSTPGEALLEMARDPKWRSVVQDHPNCTGDHLTALLEFELEEANNEHTSPESLNQLLYSKFLTVRTRVAKHPHLTEAQLLKLSQDHASEVLYTLLERDDLPETVMLQLAMSKHVEIRREVAKDARSTEAVLLLLALDTDQNVLMGLLTRPQLSALVLQEMVKSPQQSGRIVQLVLNHQQVNEEVLLLLCKHSESGVRTQVLAHPHITDKVVLQLSKDPDETVLRQVIFHPRASGTVLLELTREKPKLWHLIVQHENTPPEALQLMADDVVYRLCAWPRKHQPFSRRAKSLLVFWMVKRYDAKSRMYQQIRNHPNCNPAVMNLLQRVMD